MPDPDKYKLSKPGLEIDDILSRAILKTSQAPSSNKLVMIDTNNDVIFLGVGGGLSIANGLISSNIGYTEVE